MPAQVRRVLENTGLRVQIGGGIRTLADMEFYRSLGAHRIIRALSPSATSR